ncbi:PQQ-dependent sugar dehydrogenase [Bacillus sp. PS06]|uniref:PQQ-dependent sugar dehydrogenase n=1 Tax=Bacillus sp. PS06 TaxID=2764176 RepID=UPI001780088E|nr:PQQ-dependent sugar dehydrogenase [Bacillus sp. PS06]MBD8070116.1 PQQ-dependent sugar dehydrogenase [Bacillus sp. PS06]
MNKIIMFIVLLLILTACSSKNNDSTKPIEEQDSLEMTSSAAEALATNLHIPWMITKHEDTFYISQREGKIIEVDLESQHPKDHNLILTKDVLHEGEGGLLGFLLAPDFETSQLAYIYHTYREADMIKNRIVTLQKRENTWYETKELLADIPGARNHNGGRMKIGPDGLLYVTTGDAAIPELSQDKKSLAGKILRMTLDGEIPTDNPFDQSYVYSFGHRNPQGLAWDDKGNLYSTEHGQSAHDEINFIEPGNNYGWPVIEGDEEETGMTKPLFHTAETTWAPSGLEYHDGKLYIATLRGSSIRSYDLTDQSVDTIHEGSGRMRDIYIEDNTLFTITNNLDGRGQPSDDDDQLLRIKLD